MSPFTPSGHSSQPLMPALFLSHGTPMLAFAEDPYTEALKRFVSKLPRPKAIVALSAHSTSPDGIVDISIGERCQVVHDFSGFPGELYLMDYPCPGSPELSSRIAAMLADGGFQTALNAQARLDHGIWVPLRVAYPEADIPVVRVSMPYPSRAELVMKMGKLLSGLREEGVLIVGSGGMVHNLRKLNWSGKEGPAEEWAQGFESWVLQCLSRKDVSSLLNYESLAPHSRLAHPSSEHFYPIFFTLGASLTGDAAVPIFEGVQYGSLSMMSFALMH